MSASSRQVTTIPEFLAAAGDTDSTEIWSEFWSILGGWRERIAERFELAPHPSSAELASWRAGEFEGSLQTWSGPEAEWVVHSWIGNRAKGILDMNLQVWLGPHVDVPHLVIVFGTVPLIFHYSDLIPRHELATDPDHLARYFDPLNEEWLALRGDDRFTWSVSHGTYMRAVLSPVAHSYTAERTPEVIDTLRGDVASRVGRWLDWVDAAEPVPEAERPALRRRDHFLREHIYRLDPMNALAARFMDAAMVERLIRARYGAEQLAASRA